MVETISTDETGIRSIHHTNPVEMIMEVQLPLKDEKLAKLQESDPHIRQLRKQWDNNNLDTTSNTLENNILRRKIIDNGLLYMPIIVQTY